MTQISDATRQAILDRAWELFSEEGRLDVSQAEIAKRAGVSRQTIYLAYGGRAGLLLAMVRYRDRKTEHVARMREIATGTGDQPKDLMDFLETWLDYLPIIYPVAIQLDSAKLTDRDAAAAWNSRMKAGLFEGLRIILSRIHAAGGLAEGWTVEAAAAWSWTLVHPVQWRLLVIENGWSPESFQARQIAVARTVLACDTADRAVLPTSYAKADS